MSDAGAPRVALVTGANSGIGRVTAEALARQGFQVFLACRSEARTQPVLATLQAAAPIAAPQWLPLDLGCFTSVRVCAAQFLARGLPLHVLVLNAGQGGGRGQSASGFERAFGINHLGHFLLTQLLRERLCQSAPARVVTVASALHHRAHGLDFDAVCQPTRSLTGLPEYAVSKLANVLFSAELARQLAGTGVDCHCVHPGMVDTAVWRRVPRALRPLLRWAWGLVPADQGARTSVMCATDPALAGQTGRYYAREREATPSALGQDVALARALWAHSAAWTDTAGLTF